MLNRERNLCLYGDAFQKYGCAMIPRLIDYEFIVLHKGLSKYFEIFYFTYFEIFYFIYFICGLLQIGVVELYVF